MAMARWFRMGTSQGDSNRMITGSLLHPGLLSALAGAGHGAKVLIADALYPHSTGAPRAAAKVHLNLRAGTVPASEVLEVVAATVPVEAATFMKTAAGGVSEPVVEFQRLLADHRHNAGEQVSWSSLERRAFYEVCRSPDVCLLVATGETRPYANLLLTIGVP